MEIPETRYVEVGDAAVAYQVLGDGPFDLLYFFGLGSHVEALWTTLPAYATFLRHLGRICRLILFDRRGTGASDGVPPSAIPTWEGWTDDLQAVLDASGSQQAVLLGAIDAGPIAILYAAMHPERVSSLILLNTAARYLADIDYPIGASPEAVDALIETVSVAWGTTAFARATNPGGYDPEFHESVARLQRFGATPLAARTQYGYMLRSFDVRNVLSLLQMPTLVLQVTDNPMLPIEHGRYLADHIEGAQFVPIPGGDLGISPNMEQLFDEVAQFLTGERPMVEIERVLTTVLFTDIVGSTERAAELGDRRWREVLDTHDQTVREQLRTFRGKEINTTGDGFVASFDGPARAIRCAQAIVETTKGLGIELRAGLHTGECEVRDKDLGGLAVHIAARVAALAIPGEVAVSNTVKDLVVGSGIEFDDRGEHELKGVPGTWKLFAVKD